MEAKGVHASVSEFDLASQERALTFAENENSFEFEYKS
jgi:hypothetical protein